MVNDSTPTNPTGSRFGWPNPLRIEEFRKLLAVEGLPTMRVVFREERLDLPTIRVPIGLPKYRLANGRTVSLQAEYLAKNEKPPKTYSIVTQNFGKSKRYSMNCYSSFPEKQTCRITSGIQRTSKSTRSSWTNSGLW